MPAPIKKEMYFGILFKLTENSSITISEELIYKNVPFVKNI
jgi:hypothetical protein